MTGNTKAAIEILETALEKTSTFREADSLLVFEVSIFAISRYPLLSILKETYDIAFVVFT